MSALEELAGRPLVVAEDLRLLADQMRHPDLAMVRQLERAAELLALLDRATGEPAGVRIDAAWKAFAAAGLDPESDRPGDLADFVRDLAAERDQARVELERLRARVTQLECHLIRSEDERAEGWERVAKLEKIEQRAREFGADNAIPNASTTARYILGEQS